MIESKHLPREMVLENPKLITKTAKHRDNETPEQKRERCRKCKRLFSVLISLENSLKRNKSDLDNMFSNLRVLQQELKRLRDDQAYKEKISLLFQAIGLLFSGGTANAVRSAAGEVISLIGAVFSIPTNDSRIKAIINDISNKAFEYERLQRARKNFLEDISNVYEPYKTMECLPTVARRF